MISVVDLYSRRSVMLGIVTTERAFSEHYLCRLLIRVNFLNLSIICWDYPDDSTVLPISRYRRSKASLLLLSTGVTAHLRWLLQRWRYQYLYYLILLLSNYKTWGKASQTRTSYKDLLSKDLISMKPSYPKISCHRGKAPIDVPPDLPKSPNTPSMLRLIREGYQRECLLRPDFVVLTDEATGHIIFSVKMGGPRRLGGLRMATDFQFNNDKLG